MMDGEPLKKILSAQARAVERGICKVIRFVEDPSGVVYGLDENDAILIAMPISSYKALEVENDG